MEARTRLNTSTQRRCNNRKFSQISLLGIALALVSQGCSQVAQPLMAQPGVPQPGKASNTGPSFPHSESAPYSNAYFPFGYLISPNPPVPAPGSVPGDQACRDVGAVRTSSPATGLSEPSNTLELSYLPSDRGLHDQCAIEYANNARAEYLRAGRVYSSTPGVLASVLIPAGGAAIALGVEGIASGVVTGLGVGGASLLGMATFYQHKDREVVYNTGATAIDCLLTTMQPFTNVSDDTLHLLAGNLTDLSVAKAQLEQAMTAFQNLHIYDDCAPAHAKAQKEAAALLSAAQTADKAAQTSLQAGIDFNTSTLASPTTIVYSVYSINDGIIKGLISTEPDVQSLAGNLKGVIPDSADSLAGIKQAQSATSQSAAAMSAAQSNQPPAVLNAAQTGVNSDNLTATAQNLKANAATLTAKAENLSLLSSTNIQANPPPAAAAAASSQAQSQANQAQSQANQAQSQANQAQTAAQTAESTAVRDGVQREQVRLYRSMLWVNTLLLRISSILGSATKPPDAKACVQLTAQAKEPKVLTLKPSGQIPVSAGSKTTISVKGVTTKPEVFPLSPQSEVTASISDNQIEVSVEEGTTETLYPFVLMDGATSETFQVLVTKKALDRFGDACAQPPPPPKHKKRHNTAAATP